MICFTSLRIVESLGVYTDFRHASSSGEAYLLHAAMMQFGSAGVTNVVGEDNPPGIFIHILQIVTNDSINEHPVIITTYRS